MDLKNLKKELLKDPEFKKEYYKRDLAFEIAQTLIEARIIKGITQEKLAKMIGTKQPGIARVESGNYLPSLSFLEKIAKAFNTHLVICFGFMLPKYQLVFNFINLKSGDEEIKLENRERVFSYPKTIKFETCSSESLQNEDYLSI